MTKKIAISLPDALLDHARGAVAAGRAESVSAYVAGAIAERAKQEDLAALLAEMLSETGGPLTDDERSRADRLLDA